MKFEKLTVPKKNTEARPTCLAKLIETDQRLKYQNNLNLPEEKIGKTLEDIDIGKGFFYRVSVPQATTSIINNWNWIR